MKYLRSESDVTRKAVCVVGMMCPPYSPLNWFLLEDKETALKARKELGIKNKPGYIVWFGEYRLFKLSIWPHDGNKYEVGDLN